MTYTTNLALPNMINKYGVPQTNVKRMFSITVLQFHITILASNAIMVIS